MQLDNFIKERFMKFVLILMRPFDQSFCRGAGIIDGVLALGIIGIGVSANLSIFSSSNKASRSSVSNLSLANLKVFLTETLHSKVTFESSDKNIQIRNCVKKPGTCMNNTTLTGAIFEPAEGYAIASTNGVEYLLNGDIARSPDEIQIAAYKVKLTEMRSFCLNGESSCDIASEIFVSYLIEPITKNFRILGAPNKAYFFNGGKIKKQFQYASTAIVRISDFKVSEELTTNDCNNGPGDYKAKEEDKTTKEVYKIFKGDRYKPFSPYVLNGLENFSNDGKTATVICNNNLGHPDTGERGFKGIQGEKGEAGRIGRNGPRGPRGYRGAAPGSYFGRWHQQYQSAAVYIRRDSVE